MERNILQEIKIGAVVIAVLLLMGVSIFMLGGSTDLLQTRFRLNASYTDISGLREGAVVRLAGIHVGEVTHIQFPDDPAEKRVFVQLNIMECHQVRIRKDSVASIQTEGVLGDKYISVSVGSPDEPILVHGDWITTTEPLEMLSYVNKASEILENSAGISRKVNFMLGDDQDSARASMANAIVSLEELIKQVEEGNGILHALIYDEYMATHVRRSLANLEESTATLARITQELEQGEGFAHEIIYGDEALELAAEVGDLAAAMQALTTDLKSEDSLINALLYDPERVGIIDELAVTATALREVSQSIQRGDGTLGMLAQDPALYEDLRALVGGAQRNKLLRAYIRRTVERAEEEDATSWQPEQ